jgi:hypothetical protein
LSFDYVLFFASIIKRNCYFNLRIELSDIENKAVKFNFYMLKNTLKTCVKEKGDKNHLDSV